MTHLRHSVLALIAALTVFFNIERLDFDQENVIDISSFAYVVAACGVAAVLIVPRFRRYPARITVGLWLIVYVALRLAVFNSRPLIGGIHTYLLITELVLLSATLWSAHRVALDVQDFEQAIEHISLPRLGRQIQRLDQATEDIQTEMIRSRRHRRPLTVVVVEPDPDSLKASLHRTVEEVQRSMIQRYVIRSLTRVITNALRRTDMVLEQPGQGRFIVLSPETPASNTDILLERIHDAANHQLGVTVRCGVASFPDNALTFEELVRTAEGQLAPAADTGQPVSADSTA